MRNIRKILKDFLPPVSFRFLRRLRQADIKFVGNYRSWEEAASKSSGYYAEHILSKVLEATLKVKKGDAAFERDSVLFDEAEYDWAVLTGLMLASSLNKGRLNVLDFGGSLGSTYFQNRIFFRSLPDIKWNIVEQINYVLTAKHHIQDEYLRFYSTIEACFDENKPNVVLFSSVLEYLPDPFAILEKVITSCVEIIIINRSPFSKNGSEKFVIQHVPSKFFDATIPCQILSQKAIKDFFISNNMDLIATFPCIGGETESFCYEGLIFKRRTNEMSVM